MKMKLVWLVFAALCARALTETTESTTDGATESTTAGNAESTTTETTESTTAGNAESTTAGNAESTTTETAESTTAGNTESTTAGNTESTTVGNTESTTAEATEGSSTTPPNSTPTACNPDAPPTCDNDAIKFCGFDNKFQSIPCTAINPRTPFCHCKKTACVARRPAECEISAGQDAKCSVEGLLPDPKDCRAFAYCDKDKKLHLSKCPSRELVFSPSLGKCVRNAPCFTPRCPGGVLPVYIPWRGAPEYYMYCVGGKGQVRRCEQPGYAFEQGAGCAFLCKESGYFKEPNTDKCKNGFYNRCYRSGGKYRREEKNCGKIAGVQLTFNARFNVCFPGDHC